MRVLALLLSLALAVLVLAQEQAPQAPMRASAQFGLDLRSQASDCLRSCHNAATQVMLLKGLGINSAVFVTRNCEDPVRLSRLG
jgi:hypothetical protein